MCRRRSNRAGMAKVLSQPQYLNAPEVVVEQVHRRPLCRRARNHQDDDDRVDFQPFPHYSAAVWLMTQLRRWNMLKEDVDYKKLAQQVMLATDAARIMREMGATPPAADFGKEIILGKEFDSSKPEEYLRSVRKPAVEHHACDGISRAPGSRRWRSSSLSSRSGICSPRAGGPIRPVSIRNTRGSPARAPSAEHGRHSDAGRRRAARLGAPATPSIAANPNNLGIAWHLCIRSGACCSGYALA